MKNDIFYSKLKNKYIALSHILGLAIILMILIFAQDNLWALFFILPSLIFFVISYGIAVRFSDYKYKRYYAIGPIKVGFWRNLPPISRVRIKQKKYKAGLDSIIPSKTIKESAFVIHLLSKNNKQLLIYYGGFSKAMEIGKVIAQRLDVSLEEAFMKNENQ